MKHATTAVLDNTLGFRCNGCGFLTTRLILIVVARFFYRLCRRSLSGRLYNGCLGVATLLFVVVATTRRRHAQELVISMRDLLVDVVDVEFFQVRPVLLLFVHLVACDVDRRSQ